MTKDSMAIYAADIRPLVAADESAWKALWRAYAGELGEMVTEAEIERAWFMLMAPDVPLHGLAAVTEGVLAAFLLYSPIPYPWGSGSACYLVDVAVASAFRRRGIARSLIVTLADLGRRHGWRHIFWMAHRENVAARRLYAEIATETDLVRYDLPLMSSVTQPTSIARARPRKHFGEACGGPFASEVDI